MTFNRNTLSKELWLLREDVNKLLVTALRFLLIGTDFYLRIYMIRIEISSFLNFQQQSSWHVWNQWSKGINTFIWFMEFPINLIKLWSILLFLNGYL